MYHFNRRTAEPLEPTSAPGCDKPTSRCQTVSSIWTLRNHKPVIPGVPFIRWAMVFPHRTTGSLWPTFYIPVRYVYLTVKQTYAITLYNKYLFEFALCTPPLLFRRRPPQSNYLSQAVFLKNLVKLNIKDGISLTLSLPSILHKIYNFTT